MGVILRVSCRRADCPNSYEDHKWGKIRATARGWYLSRKSGEAWCPDHTPSWVAEWRKKKG